MPYEVEFPLIDDKWSERYLCIGDGHPLHQPQREIPVVFELHRPPKEDQEEIELTGSIVYIVANSGVIQGKCCYPSLMTNTLPVILIESVGQDVFDELQNTGTFELEEDDDKLTVKWKPLESSAECE